jgi:hypothetical protein
LNELGLGGELFVVLRTTAIHFITHFTILPCCNTLQVVLLLTTHLSITPHHIVDHRRSFIIRSFITQQQQNMAAGSSNNSSSLCGDSINSRRGLLALLWSVVSLLTVIAFLTAFIFAVSTQNNSNEEDEYGNQYDNYYDGQGSQDMSAENEQTDPEVAVTSRALAFSALWTGVMAALLSVFGTVILGWQSPTGQYYTCCSSSVHRTTPLGLGSFIGALMMFANLTLICSVLFGEFEVRKK